MSAERLEALCNRLEAALSRIERCGGAGGAGAAAEGGEATARICKSVFFLSEECCVLSFYLSPSSRARRFRGSL